MKRTYFYLPASDHRALAAHVEKSGVSASDYVRQAVQEKLDRDALMAQVTRTREELAELLTEIRAEASRARREQLDENRRGLEQMREEASKSLRKNEEMTKTFVLALGGIATSTPPKTRPSAFDGDGPMRVPG